MTECARFWPAAKLPDERWKEGPLWLSLRVSASRWERRALAFSRLISCASDVIDVTWVVVCHTYDSLDLLWSEWRLLNAGFGGG